MWLFPSGLRGSCFNRWWRSSCFLCTNNFWRSITAVVPCVVLHPVQLITTTAALLDKELHDEENNHCCDDSSEKQGHEKCHHYSYGNWEQKKSEL